MGKPASSVNLKHFWRGLSTNLEACCIFQPDPNLSDPEPLILNQMESFQTPMDSDWTSSALSEPVSSPTAGSSPCHTLTPYSQPARSPCIGFNCALSVYPHTVPSGIAISSSHERALGCSYLSFPAAPILDNTFTASES
jgi:hypothetical protein